MIRWLKITFGLLIALSLNTLFVTRIAFEVLGASTAADDFALLKSRMPKVWSWLFTTPWWVPSIILLAMTAVAAWLLWTGVRGAAVHSEEGDPLLTEKDVERILRERLPAAPDQPDVRGALDLIWDALNRERFRPLLQGNMAALNSEISAAREKLEADPKSWRSVVQLLASSVNSHGSILGLLEEGEQSDKYKKNPYRPVKGDELIEDMEGKQDFRSVIDRVLLLQDRMNAVYRATVVKPLTARDFYTRLLQDIEQGKQP